MTSRTEQLGPAYTDALDEYVRTPSESALQVAYELGRQAVTADVGVLGLAELHINAVVRALESMPAAETVRVATAAGEFFLESLSAFEMVQRGVRDARATALAAKQQTAMLRRLSSFLADTSLALEGPEALQEVLQLVAEQARELVGARACLAMLVLADMDAPLVAAATKEPEKLPDVRAAIADLASDETNMDTIAAALGIRSQPDGLLDAPLVGLDGRALGSLRLIEKAQGFTDMDAATAVHLAQMASAAFERAQLYLRRASG